MSQLPPVALPSDEPVVIVDETPADTYLDFWMEGASLREAEEERKKEEWKRKEAMEEAMKHCILALADKEKEDKRRKEEDLKKDESELSDSQFFRKYWE